MKIVLSDELSSSIKKFTQTVFFVAFVDFIGWCFWLLIRDDNIDYDVFYKINGTSFLELLIYYFILGVFPLLVLFLIFKVLYYLFENIEIH